MDYRLKGRGQSLQVCRAPPVTSAPRGKGWRTTDAASVFPLAATDPITNNRDNGRASRASDSRKGAKRGSTGHRRRRREQAVLDGTVVAFRQLILDVKRDEILCIVGPSGCGKTWLLRSPRDFL
jgi:ABC-type glutathione transport system ATPase component